MMQEIRISDVLIMMMLMFSLDRALNINEATPEWFFMPTPITETLAMF
jgi:hypothetical protein